VASSNDDSPDNAQGHSPYKIMAMLATHNELHRYVSKDNMKIVILRHGKPVTPSLRKLSASAFSDWVHEYNVAGLCPTSQPTDHVIKHADECNAVVCSALPRSVESAKAFNNKGFFFLDPIFNEAGLPVANWQAMKLPPQIWAVVFRVLWLLGYSNNSESLKETKSRASKAVERLSDIARKYESVLFVGHGVYNRILANELRRHGWLGPKNPGSKHWEFGVYEK
jgi:hypothetical protein